MLGVQMVEVDIEDDSIPIKKEANDECLMPLGPTFLSTICGKTHYKTVSCVEYDIFKTEVFLCFNQECGKIFESELELEQHGNSCQVPTAPLCNETGAVQDEDSYLERPNMRQCKTCKKNFKKRTRYLQHMRIFHPELIKCTVLGCYQFFRNQSDFKEHRMIKHKNCVFCAICTKDYKSKLTLQRHILDQHLQKKIKNKQQSKFERIVVGKTECSYCGEFYKDVGEHLTLRHPEKCIKCLQSGCCLVFLNEEAMQVHFRLFHVPAKCDESQSQLISKKQLQTLKKNVSKKEKTECSYCGKFKKNISVHVKTVHPDKVFKCSQANCRSVFVTEKHLHHHLQKLHKSTKCIYCEEVFDKKILYISHVKKRHPGTELFNCSFYGCIRFFKSYLEMEQHYKENHPFQAKCDLCGYLAPSLDKILKHMNRNHYPAFENEKEKLKKRIAGKRECCYCGKYVKHLYAHLRITHPEEMLKRSRANCLAPTMKRILWHMKKRHNKKAGLLTQNNAKMTMFQIIPEDDAKQNCTFCLKDIPLLQMDSHNNDTICNKCKKSFPCKGLLAQHAPTCILKCSVCCKRFKSTTLLKLHELTHLQASRSEKTEIQKALGFKCENV